MARGQRLVEIEDFPKKVKKLLTVMVVLLLFGTFGFILLDDETIKSAFLRTLETMVFTFDDVTTFPERLLEIFIALVGVFLIWWTLWGLADMILEGNLGKYLKSQSSRIKIRNMENHIVIAGGGRVGEEVARILTEKKREFVIAEIDSEVIKELKKKKYYVVEGSAEQDKVLIDAGIKKAKKLIITIPKTETNILITLAAKELNPEIEIHARAENVKFVSKLKKAGAKAVVVPEVVAGSRLADGLGK